MTGPSPGVPIDRGVEAVDQLGVTVHSYPTDDPRAVVAQRHHVEVLDRLAGVADFQVPAVTGDFDGWLVTTRPVGEPADRPDRHPDPDDLIVAVGTGLRVLHELSIGPPSDGPPAAVEPPPEGWEEVSARCARVVEAGLVDPGTLPQPYARYSAEELLALFIEGRPDPAPDDAELVLCHGRPELDRFLVSGGRFRGFDRLEWSVMADRHLDLAITHLSVQEVFGPEAVFRFYDAYGRDPDLARLEHYVLAAHLLAPAPGPVLGR